MKNLKLYITFGMQIVLLFFVSINSKAQNNFSPQWQNTIGGGSEDYLYVIQQTVDGGYICGGRSNSSISGDKTEDSQGDYDYWVVKCDGTGAILWQNTIGGSGLDELNSIQQTVDGGYICGGRSTSPISGDKTEDSQGQNDYWVVKLDDVGAIQWQNTIGGSGTDVLWSVKQTADGGYICGGYSNSPVSGDKTEDSQGFVDYWVVKLDSVGTVQWDNTIGGSGYENLWSVQQTSDGGYILGGRSSSDISGDKTENSQGDFDYWVVKLDGTGTIQWQNTIGGSGEDYLYSIQQTTDNGYICGGYSRSPISGDKTESNQGQQDYWVVKLNSTGAIIWQNTIGGSGEDILYSIQQTINGGYICGGNSKSPISGDKTESSQGLNDYWVVKLDDMGNIVSQSTLGGSGNDILYSIKQTTDGGYICGGWSESPISGDKTENSQGLNDYWVVKLSAFVGLNDHPETMMFTIFPNPATNLINLRADKKLVGSTFSVYDNTGRLVYIGEISSQNTSIVTDDFSPGIYLISVGDNINQTFKVVKK